MAAHTRGNVRNKLGQCSGFASRAGSSFALSPTGLVLITGQQDQTRLCVGFICSLIKLFNVALKRGLIDSLYVIFYTVVYLLLFKIYIYEPYFFVSVGFFVFYLSLY